MPVACEFVDDRHDPAAADGTKPEIGSIYEVRYDATRPARARHRLRGDPRYRQPPARARRRDLLGRPISHTLAFGISQAGRYLRDHIAQGFNADEDGRRVFDGVFTHVAGIGRVFHNTAVRRSRSAPAPGTRIMTFPRWNFRSPLPS